jgi:hypothetical protein
MRAEWVDRHDEESAYYNGLEPLEIRLGILLGPGRERGGARRVVIRVYSWEKDHAHGIGVNPGWLTIGHGMTAYAATVATRNWLMNYSLALENREASRDLTFVAVEIDIYPEAAA